MRGAGQMRALRRGRIWGLALVLGIALAGCEEPRSAAPPLDLAAPRLLPLGPLLAGLPAQPGTAPSLDARLQRLKARAQALRAAPL